MKLKFTLIGISFAYFSISYYGDLVSGNHYAFLWCGMAHSYAALLVFYDNSLGNSMRRCDDLMSHFDRVSESHEETKQILRESLAIVRNQGFLDNMEESKVKAVDRFIRDDYSDLDEVKS